MSANGDATSDAYGTGPPVHPEVEVPQGQGDVHADDGAGGGAGPAAQAVDVGGGGDQRVTPAPPAGGVTPPGGHELPTVPAGEGPAGPDGLPAFFQVKTFAKPSFEGYVVGGIPGNWVAARDSGAAARAGPHSPEGHAGAPGDPGAPAPAPRGPRRRHHVEAERRQDSDDDSESDDDSDDVYCPIPDMRVVMDDVKQFGRHVAHPLDGDFSCADPRGFLVADSEFVQIRSATYAALTTTIAYARSLVRGVLKDEDLDEEAKVVALRSADACMAAANHMVQYDLTFRHGGRLSAKEKVTVLPGNHGRRSSGSEDVDNFLEACHSSVYRRHALSVPDPLLAYGFPAVLDNAGRRLDTAPSPFHGLSGSVRDDDDDVSRGTDTSQPAHKKGQSRKRRNSGRSGGPGRGGGSSGGGGSRGFRGFRGGRKNNTSGDVPFQGPSQGK